MSQTRIQAGNRRRAIQRQIVLPWSKAVEIAYRSVRVRLGRSVITMAGVILAIAFMTTVLTSQAIIQRLVTLNDWKINLLLQREGVETGAEALNKGSGFAQEQIWIISLSLLVALIGIVNAMLMSVTERFREIGTMKCLGALDSFIVRLFLIESTFQGIMGTLIGIGAGVITGAAWKTARYGWTALSSAELWMQILRYSVFAFLVGTGIAIVAAIYPAYTASRMAPVDAMRADE